MARPKPTPKTPEEQALAFLTKLNTDPSIPELAPSPGTAYLSTKEILAGNLVTELTGLKSTLPAVAPETPAPPTRTSRKAGGDVVFSNEHLIELVSLKFKLSPEIARDVVFSVYNLNIAKIHASEGCELKNPQVPCKTSTANVTAR